MHRAFRVSSGLCLGLILLILLPGCRQGTFLGNRYNNFRAYYNTFYNARRAFDAGEQALELSERQIDRSRFVSIFPAAQNGSSSPSAQFEQAIEKSADLLRERPDSKWADDALLLIGKAYFYQNNFVGAEGKFRETVEAALERDQFELADEARFWLGRTLSASERFEEAVTILEEGVVRPDIRPKWRSKLRLALGELHVQQRQWADAAEALSMGIPETDDKDLSGRAQFLLGQVLEADSRFEEAATAYAEVAEHRPIYELGYAAKLSEALVLGIDVGNTEQALDLIRRMRRDGKNFQNRAEVELAHARLLGAADRLDEAEQRFDLLLYDEDYRANNVRGESYYHYAEFFRDEVGDYVRAAAYFDTAATNIRTEPGREELVTRAALKDVRRSAEVYRSYASIASDLAEADSLLYLGSLSAEDFRAAIADIERARLQQWADEQRILAERRSEQGFGNAPITRSGEFPVETDESATGLGGPRTEGIGIEAGFLNYRDPARRQDAQLAFERVWGDRPLAPNWRRLVALQSAVVEGGGPEAAGDQNQNNLGNATGPLPLDISNVPRTEEAQSRVRGERAELRYELGNVFFLSLAKPDSAAHWYGLVIDQDSDHPVVIRALYALAEVRGVQNRDSEAEALYVQVIEEQPLSAQAAQARERLGIPPLEQEASVGAHAVAEAAYDLAYGRWHDGSYSEALGQMLDLGARASDDDISPRALLASGLIFAEWARNDSLDLELGIPGEIAPQVLLDEARAFSHSDATEPGNDPETQPEPGEEALDDPGSEDEAEQDTLRAPRPIQPTQAESAEDVSEAKDQSESIPSVSDAPIDSLASITPAFDSLFVDSLAVRVPNDTTRVADEVASDSLATQPVFLRLDDLYHIVEIRYPATVYAAHASERRAALDAVLNPVEEVQASDEDSLDVVIDVMAPLSQEVIDNAPEGTFGLAGDVPLNADVGGFAWKVASVPSPLAAQAMLRNFAERGFRAAVVQESSDDRVLYNMLLGQFASLEAAEAFREELPATGVGRDLQVVPIRGLDLLDAADMDRLRPD